MTDMADLDPIVLALVQNRLDHISRQMGWVMTRTARSPIFSQSHDFSCFISDPDGTLVSQADGIPINTGGGGFAVRSILRVFGEISQYRTHRKTTTTCVNRNAVSLTDQRSVGIRNETGKVMAL